MKKAIIDVGSNSIRLAVFFDGKVQDRQKITSRLGEGKVQNDLQNEAIVRTFLALIKLIEIAVCDGVDESNIYTFATAAVRNSKNGNEFTKLANTVLKNKLDVVSGEKEGELALLGALGGKDGAVLDVGGASTELSIAKGGKLIYSKSVPIGAVVLRDLCGEDREKLQKVIDGEIAKFDVEGINSLIAVGGTATTCALVDLAPLPYDRNLINNHYLSEEKMSEEVDRLFELSIKERVGAFGMEIRRAEIIAGGALLLQSVMRKFNLSGITVSEDDNLEGYYRFLEDK